MTAVRAIGGVVAAPAPVVCTLDGDGQNPPADLAVVLAPLLDPAAPAGLGLVAGQQVGRRDSFSKRLASALGNTIRAALLRDGTRDSGCGIKAFCRDAFLALPYFNHMHRYLPALFARDGWEVRRVNVGQPGQESARIAFGEYRSDPEFFFSDTPLPFRARETGTLALWRAFRTGGNTGLAADAVRAELVRRGLFPRAWRADALRVLLTGFALYSAISLVDAMSASRQVPAWAAPVLCLLAAALLLARKRL